MSTALPVPRTSIPSPKPMSVARLWSGVVEGHLVTVTGCRRSNWVNWKGEERSCESEEAQVGSGRKAWGLAGLPLPRPASAWPGLPDGKTAAQGEIFLRWCKESVASSVENGRSIRFDSDQQGRRVSGSGWASDGAATRLAGGFTVTVRCGAVRCGAVADGGEGRGRSKERDVLPCCCCCCC